MKIPAAVLLCVVPCLAWSAPPAAPAGARAGVASAVARYVNAISCGGVRVTPGDVLVLSKGYPETPLAKYAVLWVGDVGCVGGSDAEKTQLAVATFNAGQYMVQPELSSPVVAFESPVRRITRVVSYSARVLVLEGKEVGPGDVSDAPSVPVRFMLRADAKGNWAMVDKVFLANEGAPD